MLRLVVRFCSITIIFNVKIVKSSSTTTQEPTNTTISTTEFTESTQSTTPSLDDYDWEVFCKFQHNAYDCLNDGIGRTRYYYDVKLEECKEFVYGGCAGNQRNLFLNMKDCRQTCKVPGKKPLDAYYHKSVYCRLQPEFGQCDDYNPMFYFSVTQRKCVGFSYSGCGGNQNKFTTQNFCHRVCEDAVDAYGKPVDSYLKYIPS